MVKMGRPPEEISQVRRIPSIFMILVFVMLILSAAALYQVIEAYRREGALDLANIVLSLSAIVISVYMFLQLRAKPLRLGFERQDVVTTVECPKCGDKNTREFTRGDFIFKELEPCEKCSENKIISSIYLKPKEKEKKKKKSPS